VVQQRRAARSVAVGLIAICLIAVGLIDQAVSVAIR
jgi:hypothetical protein